MVTERQLDELWYDYTAVGKKRVAWKAAERAERAARLEQQPRANAETQEDADNDRL